MSVKNINDAFIINEFQKENISLFGKDPSFDNTKTAIRHRFPSLSDDECNSLIDIFKNISLNNQNNTELTVTAPNSFKLKNIPSINAPNMSPKVAIKYVTPVATKDFTNGI